MTVSVHVANSNFHSLQSILFSCSLMWIFVWNSPPLLFFLTCFLLSTLLYSTLLYSTLLYSTLLYSTPLHSTPLHYNSRFNSRLITLRQSSSMRITSLHIASSRLILLHSFTSLLLTPSDIASRRVRSGHLTSLYSTLLLSTPLLFTPRNGCSRSCAI